MEGAMHALEKSLALALEAVFIARLLLLGAGLSLDSFAARGLGAGFFAAFGQIAAARPGYTGGHAGIKQDGQIRLQSCAENAMQRQYGL